MSIDIRPGTEQDVPLILGFINELAEYEKLSHAVVATESLLREHLFGPSPAARTLIGSLDGTPVGFALFFRSFSTFVGRPGIYLEDLFVRKSARGSGVGKALLKAVARLAVEQNCGRLEWSVLDWNEPSIGFYKKLGAVPLDDWTMFRVTGDALQKLASE
ncbi:MAG TPA: GNAT family N-acetyltransferase [Tepidisphaeraceae bacterium]|nr:GNAT family N-acetyltransferase [Tepidisphaeraceae bacterium]